MKLKLDGLRLNILALLILPFSLILVAVALLAVGWHQKDMRQLVAERDERAVRATAATIGEQLNHRLSAVRALALRAEDGAEPRQILSELPFFLSDFDAGIVFLSPQGEPLDWSANYLSWPEALLIAEYGPAAQQLAVFEIDGEHYALVHAEGGGLTVAAAFSLRRLLQSAELSPGVSQDRYTATLTDQRGKLLHSIGDPPEIKNMLSNPGIQAALRGESGSTFFEIGGQERVLAFSPIHPPGWALLVEEPWETVGSQRLDHSLTAPLILIPALLMTAITLWFVARKVVDPLRVIEEQANQIAAGDFSAAAQPVRGIAEVQRLQQRLNGMAQKIEAYQRALQQYIGSITAAQEDERSRLARELHDQTIQELIAIAQRLQMALHELPTKSDGLGARLRALEEQTNQTILGVRRLIKGLRPIYLEDLGLSTALEMLAADASAEYQIPISFKSEGEPRRLDPAFELALYRIAQEALANLGRHSRATQANLVLQFTDKDLELLIADNGIGMQSAPGAVRIPPGHFGLLGMRERAELIGAQLMIETQPNAGTRISVRLPGRPLAAGR